MTTVSVLIATKDRPDDLRECLRSVLSQDVAPKEVIVIDQGARAQAQRLRGLFAGSQILLRYDHAPQLPGLTHARNRAIDLASGEVLLFVDDDVVLDSRYLSMMLNVFDEDRAARIGGVSGRIINLPDTLSAVQRFRSWLFYRGPFAVERDALEFHLRPGDRPRRARRLHGSNMAFRRRVVDIIRFDESYSGYSFGEDRDFSVQAARLFELRWVPHATLIHKQTPKSRLDRERFCELRVLSWLRFYRLWPDTPWTRLCYLWLNVGFAVLLVKIWDPATVRGTFRGFVRLVRILRGQAQLTAALGDGWQPRAT